jgi:hypothetical protein
MGELTEWLIIIGLLFLGLYTMYAIKNEKNDYLKTAVTFKFNGLNFLIPKWWTETHNDSDYVSFERKDTRYDWAAKFYFFIDETKTPIEELFKEKIQELNLIFDRDSSVIYNPTDFKKNPYVSENLIEIVRIEGTATEDEENRVYYDGVLYRFVKTGECIFCSSRSGVLNGGIEGPFFEEAILNFQVDLEN